MWYEKYEETMKKKKKKPRNLWSFNRRDHTEVNMLTLQDIAGQFSMPPPLPNGSITHKAGLILYFLSFFPSPRIADVQFAVVGHDKYNFRTMCIEYTIEFSCGGRCFQRATLVTGSKTSKDQECFKR